MKSPSWRWWVCGALMLATVLNYADRQALPQLATGLKALYHIGDARYGWLEAGFSWAFAVGSVLGGVAADRWGPRRVYPVVLVGWSLAGMLTPVLADPAVTQWLEVDGDDPGAGPFRWLLGCRVVLGLFEAGHWPCAILTVRQILPAKDRPLGNGLLQGGASLGAIAVPLYVRGLAGVGVGWAGVFTSLGAVGFLWVPLWLLLVRKGDLDGPPPPAATGAVPPAGRSLVRMMAALALVIGSLTVSWQFLRAWMPKYLRESQGYPDAAADAIMIAFFVATDVGCLLAGALVRALAARGWAVHPARVTGYAIFVGVAALAALVPLAGSREVAVGLLILAAAGVLGLHPYYYAFAQDLPARRTGTLSGLVVFGGWVANGVVQQTAGAHIQATRSYDAAFVAAGLAPLVGLLAVVWLWKPAGGDSQTGDETADERRGACG